MFNVTGSIPSQPSASSSLSMSKKVVVFVVSILIVCIFGAIFVSQQLVHAPDPKLSLSKTLGDGLPPNQAASAKSVLLPGSEAHEISTANPDTSGKIKHLILANPVKTIAITSVIAAVLVGIIVTAVLLSINGSEKVDAVITPILANLSFKVDSDVEARPDLTDPEKVDELDEMDFATNAGIGIGVGLVVIVRGFFYHYRNHPESTLSWSKGSTVVSKNEKTGGCCGRVFFGNQHSCS